MLLLKFPDADAKALSEISTIGRNPDCDVVLPLPAISRNHARISQRDGRFWIVDTSSTGTFLNGIKITGEAPLAARDVLHFNGSAKARIVDSEVIEAPTDPGVVLPERIDQIEKSLSVYGERQEEIAQDFHTKFKEISQRQDRNEASDRQARQEHKEQLGALHEYLKKGACESLIREKGEVVLLWAAVLASLAIFGGCILLVEERRERPIESAIEMLSANNEAAGAVGFIAALASIRGKQIKRKEQNEPLVCASKNS